MRVSLNSRSLEKTLLNVVDYSVGFLDGVKKGKNVFLKNLGEGVIYALNRYIDTNAKMNESALHHVYEWYQTGSPSARLFDIDYTISGVGLSISGTFKQSQSVSANSSEPFYNKAKIMESGMPVVIKPKRSSVLVFEDNGETVFTKNPVKVDNPGGPNVRGSFNKVFDEFMSVYFKQSFLKASGIYDYLSRPTIYKKEIASGAKLGKSKGLSVGFKWVANAKIGVE